MRVLSMENGIVCQLRCQLGICSHCDLESVAQFERQAQTCSCFVFCLLSRFFLHDQKLARCIGFGERLCRRSSHRRGCLASGSFFLGDTIQWPQKGVVMGCGRWA